AIQAREWAMAESSLAQLEKLLPEAERGGLDAQRFRLLSGRQDYEGATKLAARICGAPGVDAIMLNQLAWELAIQEGGGERDLALAEKLARRAQEVANKDAQQAEILDTLARVLFLKGQKSPAIELQAKAVELAKNRRKDQFQETLDSY